MAEASTHLFRNEEAIHPRVEEILLALEESESALTGTIVELSPLQSIDPFDVFETEKMEFSSGSRKLIEEKVKTDHFDQLIAVLIRLPSGDIVADFYTNKSSSVDSYPTIESLAVNQGVNHTSVHQLVGKKVQVSRDEGRWKISTGEDNNGHQHTVTKRHYLLPFIPAAIPFLLGGVGAVLLDVPSLAAVGGGLVGSILLYSMTLYYLLAKAREHEVPSILQERISPSHSTEEDIIENSSIVDVEQAEFQGLDTMADEDELDNDRAVMENLVIQATIPPHGEVNIPLRSPSTSWNQTALKSFIYHISPSVDELPQSIDSLFPVVFEDSELRVRPEDLPDSPQRPLSIAETYADLYVGFVNRKLGVPTRAEKYA